MRAGSQYTAPTKGQDTHPSQPPMPPHGLLGSSKKASLFLSMLRNDEAFSFYKSLFPCRSTEKRAFFIPSNPPFGLPKLKAEINPRARKGRRTSMRTISQISDREFNLQIEGTMKNREWDRLSLSNLPSRVASYLEKLNSAQSVDKTSFAIKTLREAFDLPEDLVQDLVYEDRAEVVEDSIRGFIKRNFLANRGRKMAERIGLHYWPALAFGPSIDPKAYLIAEQVQSKGGKYASWGTKIPGMEGWGNLPKAFEPGGWDMRGHWGNSPWNIQRMWFNAGCKDSPKFRIQVARHTEVPKRITGGRVKDYLRGLAWTKSPEGRMQGDLTVRALTALGRISPWARYVALENVFTIVSSSYVEGTKLFDLNELNWAEVSRLQKLPKWKIVQEAPYLPMRMRWGLVKEDLPFTLKNRETEDELDESLGGRINPQDVKPGLQSLGAWEAHKEWMFTEIIPAYAASMFFRKELSKAMSMTEMSLHDLGQSIMRMPQDVMRRKTESSTAWVAFVFSTKLEALKYAQYWKAIEEGIGRLPKSLEELEALCRRFRYGYVATERKGIAQAAARLKLGQREYEQYRDFMTNTPPSQAKCLPKVKVEGKDVELEGDWVLESLAAGDPIGPMLGLATNCCQHLNGAAKSCAKAIWNHRRAGAWVVRYKGKIIAQSYVWSSADVLVLDSIEALSGAYMEGIAALYKKAATLLAEEGWETYVGHTGYGITKSVIAYLGLGKKVNIPDRCPSYYTDAHGGHRI